jgi:hypothetical protein
MKNIFLLILDLVTLGCFVWVKDCYERISQEFYFYIQTYDLMSLIYYFFKILVI